MNTDIEALKKEQEADEEVDRSFTANPFKVLIQNFFKNEFHASAYRKMPFADAKALVDSNLKRISDTYVGPYLSGGNNLRHKCAKTKTIVELLTAMNEYLFK